MSSGAESNACDCCVSALARWSSCLNALNLWQLSRLLLKTAAFLEYDWSSVLRTDDEGEAEEGRARSKSRGSGRGSGQGKGKGDLGKQKKAATAGMCSYV